ncbi:retrovirus-related pol polyprotein from transposon TNT 1-94 [Tanacetum coccineum]|uniref:Retrovirus-related pol polyprotein from transposon TNT 1-94 n=1 Tax=Tanacetum coccineum TaxID=301880 RepID=A0ABQ5EF14_9ASTR
MQQFWYSIKKVQGTDSYEFLLANKKCTVNAEVFRTILDIYPRVEGVDFTDVPDDDTTLSFLINLGYKGPLDVQRENVDYPELIWEDIAYQIDHRKEKRSRRENMPYPRFTKIIINHFLKQHKSLTNLNYQHYRTIKDDGIVSRLNFVRIGSKGKKTVDDSQEIVDVSEVSEPEPEPKPTRKKTSSKRRVKKKVTLSADDNIISDDPDAALELDKSIRKTKAEETKATRKFHATHAMIMTEHVLESARRRKSGKVTSDPPKKVKSAPSLTPEEQEASNIMQALKEIVSTASSDRTGIKPGVPDEEKDITEEKVILERGDEQDSEYFDDDNDDVDKDDKDGDADDEGMIISVLHKMLMMKMSKLNPMRMISISDEEVTDAAKADAKKTSEVKDDAKKTELPPSSSSLSVSSGFGDQFLKLSFDSSWYPSMLGVPVSVISKPTVLTPVQESPLIAIVTTLPHPSVPKNQTPLVDLEQGFEKSASEILQIKREQVEKQHKLKFTIKSTDKAALKEYDLKSAVYRSMHANKSFNKNPANHLLYNALMEALIKDENAMDKGVTNTVKDHKRKNDDDEDDDDDNEDPPGGPNHGKKTKRRRTKDYESSKKPSSTKETSKGKAPSKGSKTSKSTPVKEPVEEPIAEVVMDDVGDDLVHDEDQPQDASKPKTTKTLNPDWFKQSPRPPNKLDWNNIEGYCYPFDLSKPLPLQGPPGHRTVVGDYFFNNDLEYLKTSDPEVTYFTSIMKTKVAEYVIKGIEDMVPTLWSTIKHVYDKDAEKNLMNTSSSIGVSTKSDDTMNEDTPVGVASAIKEGVTPYVVDMMVEMEKISSLEDIIVLESFPTLTMPVTTTAGNAPSKSSGNGINEVVLVDSIRAISERFANTAYGFFLGEKVAYPVVANYVRNTWGKYRLVCSMFSASTELFSFQFSSMDGLDAMLENGLWFIQNNSLILKKWHPDENLLKEDVSTVPVWVKLHGVPVTAFSEDALSAIATKLADVELKDNIVVAMPKITREGNYTCNVHVEYEWKPPKCSSCKVFRHIHEECPKNIGAGEKKTVMKPSQTS